MSGTSDSRKPPEGFTAHLIRLVQACGDTLKKHAAEIVGTKSGTTSFQIVIELPRIENFEMVFPDIKVIQTYVSDEALKVEMERTYGHLSAPDDGSLPDTDLFPNAEEILKDCCCANPPASPEMESADDD